MGKKNGNLKTRAFVTNNGPLPRPRPAGKPRKRSLLTRVVALVLAVCVCALLIPVGVFAATTGEVRLNVRKKTLSYYETYQLKVKGTDKPVTWSSSDPKIVRVSKNGKVRAIAKKPSRATITAQVAGQKLDCVVVVDVNTKMSVENMAERSMDKVKDLMVEKGYTVTSEEVDTYYNEIYGRFVCKRYLQLYGEYRLDFYGDIMYNYEKQELMDIYFLIFSNKRTNKIISERSASPWSLTDALEYIKNFNGKRRT